MVSLHFCQLDTSKARCITKVKGQSYKQKEITKADRQNCNAKSTSRSKITKNKKTKIKREIKMMTKSHNKLTNRNRS